MRDLSLHILDLEFKDNVKAHLLQPDGRYIRQDKRGKTLINSQLEFCKEATKAAADHQEKKASGRVFVPAEPLEAPESMQADL